MKHLITFGCVVFVLLLCSCNISHNKVVPVPTIFDSTGGNVRIDCTECPPDAIVFTPAGIAYRANVMSVGKPNPWPPFVSDNTTVGDLRISYRANIDSPAGMVRNNIFDIRRGSRGFNDSNDISLYSLGVPDGFSLYISDSGGIPGEERLALTIKIDKDMTPGKYRFQIGVLFDGRRYPAVPCTINVTLP